MIGHTPQVFTLQFDGIASVLKTTVGVGSAFDPKITAVPLLNSFVAIWDTGATGSVISKDVVDKVGLRPTGVTNVHTAGGMRQCNTYMVSILATNGVGFPSIVATRADLQGADVLIGMDIITQGDFAITNTMGKTTFSFRCPSCERIDFGDPTLPEVGRNDPCPCGSGQKYKHCHGNRR